MNLRKVKKIAEFFSKTPLHPQWLLSRHGDSNYRYIASKINNAEINNAESNNTKSNNSVLDIGCGHKLIKNYIDNNIKYYGLDYYKTAKDWYDSVPDIYGDAQALPIASASMVNVLLLDVLEHIPAPDRCIKEIDRILIPGGKLVLQVPFLYPLHDIPLDFHRWTKYGFESLFRDTGLTITAIDATGKPLETAGIMLNIALCKTLINAINDKSPLLLLLLIVPILVPIINIVCALLANFSSRDDFMPLNYRIVATKNA